MTAAVLAVVGAGVLGGGVAARLSTGRNEVPGSASVQASALLEAAGEGTSHLVLLIGEEVALGPASSAVAQEVTAYLGTRSDVTVLGSARGHGPPEVYLSDSGEDGLIVAHVTGTDAEVQIRSTEIADDLRAWTTLVREAYLVTGDPVRSTAMGLQRTGSMLSASAILMAVVFTSFSTGSVAHLKVLGIGISLAVLMAAFVIRSILVCRASWPSPGPPTH